MDIWKEFVSLLKVSDIPNDKVSPHFEELRSALLQFLSSMRAKASWEEWDKIPDVYKIEDKVHYLIPLTFDGEKATFCFTFIDEGETWKFQHVETITIRLDQVNNLPCSKFPDVSEKQKHWIREEVYWSKIIQIYLVLQKDMGRNYALKIFEDGVGYLLSAKTWVPFEREERAFILYICWELSNLRGDFVTLEKLEATHAIVRIKSQYFDLYKKSAHLKNQISLIEYRHLFENIWNDRARKAGWNLVVEYKEDEVVFNFKKSS